MARKWFGFGAGANRAFHAGLSDDKNFDMSRMTARQVEHYNRGVSIRETAEFQDAVTEAYENYEKNGKRHTAKDLVKDQYGRVTGKDGNRLPTPYEIYRAKVKANKAKSK